MLPYIVTYSQPFYSSKYATVDRMNGHLQIDVIVGQNRVQFLSQ
jgi:hypothetical protein